MLKYIIKKFILACYPLVFLWNMKTLGRPYLCIITPVFDPALPSLKFLIKDLQAQSLGNFIHILVSNGKSSEIKKYLEQLNKSDNRFIYSETPFQQTPNWKKLLINIGRRRNFAVKKYQAARYVFIDADSAIVDKSYVAKLFLIDKLTKKDIIITQSKLPDTTILPFFPINLGRIDITCYTFSQKLANKHRFPENINEHFGLANHFRFFKNINSPRNTIFFPFVAVNKDNRSTYKKVTSIHIEETDKVIFT